MTTYQDPPLQSRRAVRQGERNDAPFTPPSALRGAPGAGEPLSYVTQNRPPLPAYDAPPTSGRRAAAPQPAPQMPHAAPEPAAGAYRPRDYSPEARTAPPAWSPTDDRESGLLDHHTQVRAPQAQPAASLASSLAGEVNEQTLTRRELRSIRDSANVAPPAPAPSPQLDSAIAEFDTLAAQAPAPSAAPSRRSRRAAAQPDVAPEDGLGAFDALFSQPAAPAAPAQPAPQQPVQYQQPGPQQHVQPQPVVQTPEPAPYPVVLPQNPAPATDQPVAVTTGERPVGHWTTQADLDDLTQGAETTITRRVGSGAITTSALVLPQIPGHDLTTGEVMLTGSISLPSTLAATGAHAPLDESDIDHLLDPGDHQLVNTDSVPIRAIRAVSSHTGSRNQIITNVKPNRSNRALTALIVSASGMVVVVVTLLVVAVATKVI